MLKVIALSDTHERHDRVNVPEGDVLIHAGDFTFDGMPTAYAVAFKWLASLPHRYKLFTPGNHDIDFATWWRKERPAGLIPLIDEGIAINGVNFWASPFTPRFGAWAFMKSPAELRDHWERVPDNTDVLITHGPAAGRLDKPSENSVGIGDLALAERIAAVEPQLHIHGHCHGGYGTVNGGPTRSYNVSVVDEAYRVRNAVTVIDL